MKWMIRTKELFYVVTLTYCRYLIIIINMINKKIYIYKSYSYFKTIIKTTIYKILQ